ncbi:protein kinase and ribonuclease [Nadsonia fulvescens var. elongata DSM 6958]|uniref:non-specific serine/threonine protein kinase n=1 Tax=Nadsonia fulvescens var. elongata DSM 6958 TaxID=857566 RepID=A0A1E3PJC2_9ASCO|nr:protein kinase and ribonuclease [Nadsonia fulvescens var. elongata DSM 6958]
MDEIKNDTSDILPNELPSQSSERNICPKDSIRYENSLIVSKKILGYGSHGTIVFQGKYYNRDVAVKRLLLDFYDVASHEITLLQESNDHPNIVRYFCKQESKKFLYIALELCSASLYDVIEKSSLYPELVNQMTSKNTLYQIANGVSYLHSLKMVHRDIKPQNILVAPPRKNRISYSSYYHYNEHSSPVRILVTDFGVSKKLDIDQSSFGPTSALPVGTSGWMAPELLTSDNTRPRGTRAIDIFSLGCVFYYVLSGGSHPFGEEYDRNGNIIRNKVSFRNLDLLAYDYSECVDLINRMIAHKPKDRPDITDVLTHPYFWTSSQRLEFLVKLSDRMDSEIKDPPSPLIKSFESQSRKIVGKDWHTRFEKIFVNEIERQRKYRGERILDLLRAMRNKSHHYDNLPENIMALVGPLPDGYLAYFTRKFPLLFMHGYYFVKKNLQEEEGFASFFQL